jgi:hypothetical protein
MLQAFNVGSHPREAVMIQIRLDDSAVDRAARGRHSRVLWDSEVRGFGCRVPPAGHPAFVAYFRTPLGLRRVVEIGRYGSLNCEQARGLAKYIIERDGPAADRGGTAHEALARQIRAI